MIVRTLEECRQTDRLVKSTTWDSCRLLLKNDDVGFSFHITTLYAGTKTSMHYQNHFEAVFIMSGEGELENLDDGQVHKLAPGTLYVLDKHDRHILHAHSEIVCACVFNPPLNGKEVHDASGAYPLEAEIIEN
ncbi:MAG TPA: ectoine synthase [Burkholderiaceae bacterium]|jgi:L-ectoine synthase|nr:ectoine synthase [Burkholderiaceae bacterium]